MATRYCRVLRQAPPDLILLGSAMLPNMMMKRYVPWVLVSGKTLKLKPKSEIDEAAGAGNGADDPIWQR